MKIKKNYFIVGIILLLVAGIIFVRFFIGGDEDSWIKDSRGVWIKHGNPAETPNEVLQQKQIILCAMDLYVQIKKQGINFSSQCIGACGNYSIDIVHVPRTAEDDKTENQCEEFLNGETNQFVELDSKGNIARISE